MRSKLVPILLNSVPGWVRNAYPGVWPTISLAAHFDTGNYWAQGLGQVSADTLFSCTRASTKYVANGAGVLLPIASGLLPIADGAGNLVEQAATNLALQSQTFDNSFWAKNNCTVTADQAVAPDGTQTADLVVPAAASGTYKTVQSGGVGIALTGNAAVSVYYKPSGYGFLAIVGSSNVGRLTVNVASNTFVSYGAAGLSAVSTALGNGWYRVVVSATAWASGASVWFGPINAQADPSTAWTADGVSGGYLWGAQGEAGSFATSYIPTTTVAVTRAADSISLTTAASNLIPITTATLLFNMGAVPWGNDGADHILLAFLQSGSTPGVGKFSGGTIALNDGVGYRTSQAYTNGAAFKYAVAYGGSDINSSLGGGTVSNYASYAGSITGTAKPYKLGSGAGSAYWNGTFKRITVFSSQLSGVQLQALTT